MKVGGRISWNVTAICEIFKISCLTGRHHMKDDLNSRSKDRLFHLINWLNIILYLLSGIFLGYVLYTG